MKYALVLLFALAACGPNRSDDHCTADTTRCSPSGMPQRCIASGAQTAWVSDAPEPCPEATVCCLVQAVEESTLVHACAPADRSACVSEPAPTSTTVGPTEPAVDAGPGDE